MPGRSASAEYFDNWYAHKAATPTVAEIMNRHLGFPHDTRAGMITTEAIPELTAALRLDAGDTLLDLACGRGAYGLLIAQATGASLIGVDFSAEALAEARNQAVRLGVTDAEFRVGTLTESGLPAASVDAVLCTDSVQFAEEPSAAYHEIVRVLKPGGRVALTCWEPADHTDERVAPRLRRVNLGSGLRLAGLVGIEVRDRPGWLAREHAMWQEAARLEPGNNAALRSFRDEGERSLASAGRLRRVLAIATKPDGPTGPGLIPETPASGWEQLRDDR